MHAPHFWKEKSILSNALLPLAAIYGLAARLKRTSARAVKLPIPVICVGNLTAGGAGKTPVALALGGMLLSAGVGVHYLLRGYKGRIKGPVRVDLQHHTARDVGDEAMLLAEVAPTWVACDRAAGARAAYEAGAGCILMDDGFQNPCVHKDISFLVVDGEYGFGNARLLPAGPLREPVEPGLARASAVVLLGTDVHGALKERPAHLPVFVAGVHPLPEALRLRGKPVVAFAGIARPIKFYRTLQEIGCEIRKMVAYPDHYAFREKDFAFLQAKAAEMQALLVTTKKDYARLPAAMRAQTTQVPVEVVFSHPEAVAKFLSAVGSV